MALGAQNDKEIVIWPTQSIFFFRPAGASQRGPKGAIYGAAASAALAPHVIVTTHVSEARTRHDTVTVECQVKFPPAAPPAAAKKYD